MTTYRHIAGVPGEFVPGTSIMYRLDPRTKLFMSMVYGGCVLFTHSNILLGGCALVIVTLLPLCHISWRDVFKVLRSVVWLGSILAGMMYVMHLVRGTVLGLESILPFVRIVLVAGGSLLFTRTTVPVDLIESFLPSHSARVSGRVAKVIFVILVVLQFTPFLFRELARLRMLQVLRGPVNPRMWQRFTGFFTVLVPLFTFALRKADMLADAFIAKGFRFDTKRTMLQQNGFGRADVGAIFLTVILTMGAFLV